VVRKKTIWSNFIRQENHRSCALKTSAILNDRRQENSEKLGPTSNPVREKPDSERKPENETVRTLFNKNNFIVPSRERSL
jgi:hypothetical protein